MKTIKVSEQVYKRLMEDRKHFEKNIEVFYDFNDTIAEYQKILDSMVV